MEIPIIEHKYFEDVYLESISEQLRISIEDLKEKINSKDTASLNKKAERYIQTYLFNKTSHLTEDNWLSAKETFIQWKLLEGIEKDEVSKDKKKTLHEMLDLFKEQVISENNKNNTSSGFKGIIF